jgi:hypothetical protein
MLQQSEVISNANFKLFSPEEKASFKENGFILVRSLFSTEEVAKLKTTALQDINPDEVLVKGDQTGNLTKLKMWDTPGDDIYSMFSRNESVVDNAEILLGEPVYVYSAKMILKNAKEGGAWEWHQDYGYWYNYGCLLPNMLSCTIAVDKATQQNGCLQVLRGSQKIGRINHDRVNEQTVVDEERLQEAISRYELEYIEMEPGDALFFDGNILHRSDSNNSDFNRWSFIVSYNTISNKPYKRVREYGNFEPLIKVAKQAILEF